MTAAKLLTKNEAAADRGEHRCRSFCGSRKLKFRSVAVMSALPPKADIG